MRPNEVRVAWYAPDSNLAIYCRCGEKLVHLHAADPLEKVIESYGLHVPECPFGPRSVSTDDQRDRDETRR